ncbi:MAG: NfeD family protein [Actinobacteria bacterium]|nr:NfeD family protein [Actinomycetota bacterium]MBW3647921.1 NfeD family protein [Actinomycetota bacterium]
MDADLLWLIAGVVLVLTEVFALTLVLGMVGVGALAAAAVAFAGLGAAAQLIAFAATSTALLVFVRPPVKKVLDRGGTSERTDPRALAGASAVVVERVSEETGQVRINGELWRARPYAGNAPIESGFPVSIAAVEGATLLVYSPDLS